MKTITPAEAAALAAKGARIIDVREPDEFARRHIAGAVNAPLSRLDRVDAGGAPERQW
jgi:rhodanese-related sulfurtransferase